MRSGGCGLPHLSSGPAERVVYTCVTAGCPTAYSHKFKQGGLAKLRSTSPLANIGSVTSQRQPSLTGHLLPRSSSPTIITKTQRGKTLLGTHLHHTKVSFSPSLPPAQIEGVLASLQKEADSIRSAARGRVLASIHSSTTTLADYVHKLKSLCNISLMHDSVRDLAGAVEPEFELSETNVVSGWTHYPAPGEL